MRFPGASLVKAILRKKIALLTWTTSEQFLFRVGCIGTMHERAFQFHLTWHSHGLACGDNWSGVGCRETVHFFCRKAPNRSLVAGIKEASGSLLDLADLRIFFAWSVKRKSEE